MTKLPEMSWQFYKKASAGRSFTPSPQPLLKDAKMEMLLLMINKAGVSPFCPPIIEEEEPFVPSKGWAENLGESGSKHTILG